MQTFVTTVSLRSGAGTQVFTPVIDKDGAQFEPLSFEAIGLGTLNTLMSNSGNAFRDAFLVAHGMDNGSNTRRGEASSDAAGFGFKISDGGTSGAYSILSIHAQLSFGGYIPLKGYIHSVGVGTFSITLDLNDDGAAQTHVANQSFILIARGGSDLSTMIGEPMGSGLETQPGFEPVGVVFKAQTNNVGTATGTGGGGAGHYGWATRDSGQGTASIYTINQGGVERYQSAARCFGGAQGTGVLASAGLITSWTGTGFTVNAHVGGSYHAVGGPTIRAAAGDFTLRTTTGQQTITTGIKVRLLRLMCVGAAASALLRTDRATLCLGFSDGTRQACMWAGEIGSNPSSPLGARKVVDNAILLVGTPNGASTTFAIVVEFVEVDPVAGAYTIAVTTTDGSAPQVLWYVEGEDVDDEEEPEPEPEPEPEHDCECCVATKLNVINHALYKIGVSKVIESLSEDSPEAIAGVALFDPALKELQRLFPWAFATKYLEPMTLIRGPAWATDATVEDWSAARTYAPGDVVDSSGTLYYSLAASNLDHEPPDATWWSTTAPMNANGDWLYGYLYPDDCLLARRIVTVGTGRTHNAHPIPFRVGRTWSGDTDNDRLLVFSNEADAGLEYTALVECAENFMDALFEDALSWNLAMKLAPAHSRMPDMVQSCTFNYERAIARAAGVSAREQQQEPDGEASWTDQR